MPEGPSVRNSTDALRAALQGERVVHFARRFRKAKEAVGFPDKQAGEGGWGEKMGAVWNWKNALPATYPDEIFYGKLGRAVLLSMARLAELYAQAHKPLAQELAGVITQGPIQSVPLRQQYPQFLD